MPPKKIKSAKKGGKLSKADKQKLQKEADEKRQQEEEEARLQAEREEQERLERERVKQEEDERLELKDGERREDELNELRHLLEENQAAVTKWKTVAREKAKWARYMRCDGSPDPAVQQEINTHISLWREDPEVTITSVLKDCALALKLTEELEGLLRDVSEPSEAQRYQETLTTLQDLLHSKYLLTTEEILKWASRNSDIETGNMQTVIRDDNITLCLWANLNKNPRFKGYQFEEVGLAFELPKQLAVSDIAVRILHTRYDHLSPRARMAHIRAHAPSHRSLGGRDDDPPETESPDQGEMDGGGEAREGRESSMQHGGAEEEEEEVQSVRGSNGRKVGEMDGGGEAREGRESSMQHGGAEEEEEEVQSVRGSNGRKVGEMEGGGEAREGRESSMQHGGAEEEEEEEEVQSVRGSNGRKLGEMEGGGEAREGRESSMQHGGAEEEEGEVQSVRGSNGRKSAVSMLSMRSVSQKPVEERVEGGESQIETQLEAISGEGDSVIVEPVIDSCESVHAVDLLQYTPLGGVFYCNVFCLPPQALQLKGWEIRELVDTGLQVFPYPTEQSQVQSSASVRLEDSGLLTCPPVGVSVALPDSVVFLEQPQVARWDPAGKQWRTDGISDVSFEAEEARISFKMDSFYTFVLLQDTYANLPLQSWELRPLGQDSALLTVNAALVDLSITIQGDQCMLQSEQEKGLSHLLGKWMSGAALQEAMVSAGVNIFVNEYTDKYVSTCGKDPLTEHAAYEQMALLSSAVAFTWSQWNSKCGAEHLVLQACEHLGPSPVPKGSWSVYLLGAQRSQRLGIKERSEAFSPELYPGSEFHSTFVHMVQDDMSPEGVARTRKSHDLFVDTVQSLLCTTRLLTYS